MINISNKISGSLVVENDTEIHGMVTGSVTVKDGATLNLYGMVCKNLFAEKGSIINIYGVVSDTLVDYGANIELKGKVGKTHDMNSKQLTHSD